jgi:hypothetical protein
VWDQMKDWNPAIKEQPDDYVDSASKAITDTPERIKPKIVGNTTAPERQDWRPGSGIHEATFER